MKRLNFYLDEVQLNGSIYKKDCRLAGQQLQIETKMSKYQLFRHSLTTKHSLTLILLVI